jgi:CheY-like chemotaxis protein
MGGHLTVSSSRGSPDSGSIFSFSIPLGVPEEHDAEISYPSHSLLTLSPGQSVAAMVVDDIPENRAVLARMLEMVGCQVTLAESCTDALAKMDQHIPDIAFVDILMPRIGGIETAQQIRLRFGKDRIKLVAASASALAHEQREYLDAGFHAFLSKPVRCDRIYKMLSTLLRVEFDVAAPEQQTLDEGEDLPVNLPDSLRHRVVRAASVYRITELKHCIEEIERLHPESRGACDILRGCIRRYDMETILDRFGDRSQAAELAPALDDAIVS